MTAAPRPPAAPPRAELRAVELRKIAEAVATAVGRRRWATMMPERGEDAPHAAHEDLTGEQPGGGAGCGEADVGGDAEGRAVDHQPHHPHPAGHDDGDGHQDDLDERLDADDRTAQPGGEVELVFM